jgi:hypothetical protein
LIGIIAGALVNAGANALTSGDPIRADENDGAPMAGATPVGSIPTGDVLGDGVVNDGALPEVPAAVGVPESVNGALVPPPPLPLNSRQAMIPPPTATTHPQTGSGPILRVAAAFRSGIRDSLTREPF